MIGFIYNAMTFDIEKELELIVQTLVTGFAPEMIIAFGSCVKGVPRNPQDIDLCIVKETKDHRRLLSEMYLALDSNVPVDLLLYTPEEWRNCKNEQGTIAAVINKEGRVLYG